MRGFLVLIVVAVLCYMGYRYMENREANSPAPTSAASGGAARAAGAPVDLAAVTLRLNEAAQKVGVVVMQVERKSDRSAVVTVEWTGDVASLGGDFLNEAVIERKIARDFENVKVDQPMWSDAQGKRHFREAFELKF